MSLRADADSRIAPAPAAPARPRPDRKVPARSPRRRTVGALWRRCAWGGLGLAIAASGVYVWRTADLAPLGAGLAEMTAQGSALVGLSVREVQIEGRRRVGKEQIFAHLGISWGTPMFGFDAQAARLRLEALPWVETATVERQLPDTVVVRLQERTPRAVWQHENRFMVIDAKGYPITEDRTGAYAKLPLVLGEQAPKYADALLDMLKAEPDLMKRVTAAVHVGNRRWNLKMDNGIEVRLPEEDAASAWSRLAEMERQSRVLARDVLAVDMRLPDRLIVRVGAASAERLRPPPAKTR